MNMNRRQSQRVPLGTRAYLTYSKRCRSDKVIDVSVGGLRVETSARLKVGRTVKVFLPMPGKTCWRLCMVHGTVVRRDVGLGGASHIAIQWTNETDDNRQALAEFCERSAPVS